MGKVDADYIGDVECLIGVRSHVSGGKKSEREWLYKLACKQLFPFAFMAPKGAPQSDTATTSPNNEKRSFSQSLLGDFSRRKVAVLSEKAAVLSANCAL